MRPSVLVSISCPVLLSWIFLPASASAADLTLDDVVIHHGAVTATIPHVQFTDVNLSPIEARKLFDADDPEGAAVILARLKASKIFIPRFDSDGEGMRSSFYSIEADDISNGKAARLYVGAGSWTRNSPQARVSADVRPQSMENVDFTPIVATGVFNLGAIAFDHMAWSGFSAEVDAAPRESLQDQPSGQSSGETSGQAWSIGLTSVDVKLSYTAGVVTKRVFSARHLTAKPMPGSPAAAEFARIGYAALDFDFSGTEDYDPTAKTLTISDFKLTGVGVGALSVKAQLTGVPSAPLSPGLDSRLSQYDGASLDHIDLTFDDHGLLDSALSFYAGREGMPSETLRKQWVAAASVGIPLALRGATPSLALAQEISDFIQNPKTFVLNVKAKSDPVPLADIRGHLVADLNDKLVVDTSPKK